MSRGRSGTVIVVIVLALGLGVGAIGAWWVVEARPQPGAFIDALAIPGGAIVVRHERSSDRGIVELYDGDRRRWRAMVPHYAGGPGRLAMAASPRSVTVRSVRGGRPYVFAFDTAAGAKLDSFDLAGEVPPIAAAYTLPHLVTVAGERYAAEVITTPTGGVDVIGVDLEQRRLAWRIPLPWTPRDAWIAGDLLVLSGGPQALALALADGTERPAPPGPVPGLPAGLTYDPARRELRAAGGASYPLPPDAAVPARHHVARELVWVVTPRAITALDVQTLQPAATIH